MFSGLGRRFSETSRFRAEAEIVGAPSWLARRQLGREPEMLNLAAVLPGDKAGVAVAAAA